MAEKHSIEYYENILKIKPTCELVVTSITDFINSIEAINKFYKKILYRGQADKSWGIESAAYRALKSPAQKLLQDYHFDLINEVNNLHDENGYKGITLLAHLQHNGAKTCLIDYTLNPLISLWFACISEDEKVGSVYCIENSNLINGLIPIDGDSEVKALFEKSNAVYIFYPPSINRRIISQQSVFLIGSGGIIDKNKHMQIIVPAEHKKEILNQLSLIGICRKTLFPDFSGLMTWFSFENEPGRERYDEIVRKAEKYFLDYKFDDAINLFGEAISLGQDLFESGSIENAYIYYSIANVYHKQGDYSNALEWHEKALAIREKVLGKEHPDTASTYNKIAIVYHDQGDYPNALEWYEKALAIREKVLGKEHPDTAMSYNNIANVYHEQGDCPKALEWHEKALAINEKVLGKEHPDTAASYNNIASVYYYQGDYSKALEWHEKALAVREKVLGKEHPEAADVYENIGIVYEKQGEDEKALELLYKALGIYEKVYGIEHPRTKGVIKNIEIVNSMAQ